jgi:hypothetical protein
VNALQQRIHHFRVALEAALFVLCNIQVVSQTVSTVSPSQKWQIKGQTLKSCWPARGQVLPLHCALLVAEVTITVKPEIEVRVRDETVSSPTQSLRDR